MWLFQRLKILLLLRIVPAFFLVIYCGQVFSQAPIHSTKIGAEIAQNSARYEKGMYAILTGTGTSGHRGGSSVAVIVDGTVMQFDMGTMSTENLNKAGVYHDKIDYIFFTHLHMDHTAGFPEYLMYTWMRKEEPVKVFGPKGTNDVLVGANTLLKVHKRDMIEQSESFEDISYNFDNVVVNEMDKGGVVFSNKSFTVTAAPTKHHAAEGQDSFAYRVDSPYGSVVISGDTVPTVNVVNLAKDTDLLIHEAMLPDLDMVNADSLITASRNQYYLLDDDTPSKKVSSKGWKHSSFSEVGKVAARANVKRLVIYHFPPYGEVRAVRDAREPRTGSLDIEKKYDAVYSIKKEYSGPVIFGEPVMVFSISKAER